MRNVYSPVVAPNGTFYGRYPQDGPKTTEGALSRKLAAKVGGSVEVVLKFCGRADVANNDRIWEVEPIQSWRKGLRQVLAYSVETGLKPCLAIYVAGVNDASVKSIHAKLRDEFNSQVELWVYNGRGWIVPGILGTAKRFPPVISFNCERCGNLDAILRKELKYAGDPLLCSRCRGEQIAAAMDALLQDD